MRIRETLLAKAKRLAKKRKRQKEEEHNARVSVPVANIVGTTAEVEEAIELPRTGSATERGSVG